MMIIQAVTAAMSFNLICTGATDYTSLSGTEHQQFRYEYRVDLSQRKWCAEDCRSLHDFARVDPTQLALEDENVDTIREHHWSSTMIDRDTGRYHHFSASGEGGARVLARGEGQCERAPFSGFPTFQTRF